MSLGLKWADCKLRWATDTHRFKFYTQQNWTKVYNVPTPWHWGLKWLCEVAVVKCKILRKIGWAVNVYMHVLYYYHAPPTLREPSIWISATPGVYVHSFSKLAQSSVSNYRSNYKGYPLRFTIKLWVLTPHIVRFLLERCTWKNILTYMQLD